MAHIASFRALRYDPARVALPEVVTQPYDKITPEMQDRYYAASPYNLVRIILGKQQPTDHARDNRYTRAAEFFRDWRREGIFLQDSRPSLYLYLQRFTAPGSRAEMERRGFIALGQIEDYRAGVVFRHEQTMAGPKADRLELLRAARAHFGQIFIALGQIEDYRAGVVFRHEQTMAGPKADRLELLRAARAHFGQTFMLYSDPVREIEGVLAPGNDPDMETRDEYGVLHRVWKIADPNLIDLVRGKMRDKKLIIADGHHRYETALNYRDECRTMTRAAPVSGMPREHSSDNVLPRPSEAENPPYELAMMTFVNMDGPGLVILPTHRVVHGLASFSADAFHDGARAYFSVEEVDPEIDAARANTILREAGHTGTTMLALTPNRAFLLDTPQAVGSNIFAGLSLRQQSLDVVQLHRCLLEGVLGISEDAIRDQRIISYVRDTGEALAQVRGGGANVAFLMNPVRIQQVRDIAFAGEVLPQKSTDFYPKLLSGLTIYAME